MTIQDALRNTSLNHEISPPEREILLSLAGNMPKEYILAHPEKKLASAQIKKYHSFAKRRSAGEPIAYIVGKKEFFGLDFIVDKNVLIPRPETELLVENAIEKIKKYSVETQNFASLRVDDKLAVIDVGTGSGNIIISIAKNLPSKIKNKINFYAVDISKKSLEVARKNAKIYKLDKKIKFIQSYSLEYFLRNKKFPPKADQPMAEKNILIIANLPYVSPNIFKQNKNNLKFEPKTALLSRNNGLAHYIKLFEQARLLFTVHCSLILEFSPEQKSEISRIQKRLLPKAKARFFKDLAGRWRVAVITSP